MALRYEIPLTPQNQTFRVALSGVTYSMRLRWIDVMNTWSLDLSDESGKLLVGSIPLVTGSDLLGPYQYLMIPGTLTVASDHNSDAIPTASNLGIESHLYYTPNS